MLQKVDYLIVARATIGDTASIRNLYILFFLRLPYYGKKRADNAIHHSRSSIDNRSHTLLSDERDFIQKENERGAAAKNTRTA